MTHRTNDPWTQDERRILAFFWGAEPVDTTAERLCRTVAAVRTRARDAGYGHAGRGRRCINQVADATGYSWHQIMRAIRTTGIRPLVLRSGLERQRRMLTEEQVDAVIAALGEETRVATEAITVTGLADELGVAARTVQRHCRRLGVQRRMGVLRGKKDANRVRDAVKGRVR